VIPSRFTTSACAAALVVSAGLFLGACGADHSGSGAAARAGSSPATGSQITISNFMFEPMHLSTSPGATIRVTNRDAVAHTLSAVGGAFDTGDLAPDQTKTITVPSKPGTYRYICNIHQYMVGTITVR
jgi:plastocyanin